MNTMHDDDTIIDLGAASLETKGGSQIPALDNLVFSQKDNAGGLSND